MTGVYVFAVGCPSKALPSHSDFDSAHGLQSGTPTPDTVVIILLLIFCAQPICINIGTAHQKRIVQPVFS